MIFIALVVIIKIYVFLLSLLGSGKGNEGGDPVPDLDWIAEDVRKTIEIGIDPCDDFYQFSCGGFINSYELKPTQSRFTRSFNAIAEENDKVIHEIILNSDENSLVRILFNSCTDLDDIENLGIRPIETYLQEIDSLDIFSDEKLAETVASLHKLSFSPLFGLLSTADPFHPKNQIGWIRSGRSFLLPQSYYENPTEMDVYRKHINKMFELVEGQSNKEGEMVIELEKYFASKSPTPTDLRNPFETYHPITLNGLKSLAPDFDWSTYFHTVGARTNLGFTVDSPEYINNATFYFRNVANITQKKAYLKWSLIRNTASSLTKVIRDQHFDYFGKHLSGQKEQEDRETLCVKAVGRINMLGFDVGKKFIEKKFTEAYKTQVKLMLGGVKFSFGKILDELTWMDQNTLKKAKEKLNKIEDMIGFPEEHEWPDYTKGLDIKVKGWAENQLHLLSFSANRGFGEIGGRTDKGRWQMTPQQVNAYYEPTLNEMCFPAGILQYPFFHPKFPEAMNFGGVGSVIGHELSHAFDDEGSQYDAYGYLKMWWSKETREKFEKKANCIRTQYSGFQPLPGLYVNGNLTSGENIADNAGVKDAYRALERAIGKIEMKQKSELLDEYTNEQLFFISFAQIWCTKITDQMVRQRVLTDPHSPPQFRVIGTLSNSPEFAEAFQCKKGTKMNPEKKCSLF